MPPVYLGRCAPGATTGPAGAPPLPPAAVPYPGHRRRVSGAVPATMTCADPHAPSRRPRRVRPSRPSSPWPGWSPPAGQRPPPARRPRRCRPAGPRPGSPPTTAPTSGRPAAPTSPAARRPPGPSPPRSRARTAAFVASVAALQSDVARGDTAAARGRRARRPGRVRRLPGARVAATRSTPRPSTSSTPTSCPAQTFGGLHAVERDLWAGGPAATDVAALAAQAPVAQFLLSRDPPRSRGHRLGGRRPAQTGWSTPPSPSSQEHASHLGPGRRGRHRGAAAGQSVDIEPLARLVDPGTDRHGQPGVRRASTAEVAALGPPTHDPGHLGRPPPAGWPCPSSSTPPRSTLARLDRPAHPLRHRGGAVMTARRPGAISRRQLLAGSGLATAAVVPPPGPVDRREGRHLDGGTGATEPFHGVHQGGIATPEQARMVFAAYDVTASTGPGWPTCWPRGSSAAERMTAGTAVAGPSGPFAPPADTGEALDLAGRPAHPHRRLRTRRCSTVGSGWPTGVPRPSSTCRPSPVTRSIPTLIGRRPVRPGLCRRPPGGLPRRPQPGPDRARRRHPALSADRLRPDGLGRAATADPPQPPRVQGRHGQPRSDRRPVPWTRSSGWTGPATRRGCTDGTYLVARRIRIHLEAWDRSTLGDQERTIGRVEGQRGPAGLEAHEHDPLDLSALDELRRAPHPRGGPHPGGRPVHQPRRALLRRGYSFADGVDPTTGELDAGLFFICFQKDPAAPSSSRSSAAWPARTR